MARSRGNNFSEGELKNFISRVMNHLAPKRLYISEHSTVPNTPPSDKIVIFGLTGSLFIKDSTGHDFKIGSGIGTGVGSGDNTTFTGNNTFTGKLTASNGMLIPDDVFLTFGTNADATIEYDEDGTDQLRIAGDVSIDAKLTASNGMLIPDDVFLTFGTNADATIEYDEDGTDQLRIAGDVIVDAKLTASNGMLIPDDVFLTFGTGGDVTIEYDEDGTDELRFAGAAVTFEQAVTFDGNVTLGDAAADTITVSGDLTASNGLLIPDDVFLTFGTGADATIEYDEDGTDQLRFAGADVIFESSVTLGNATTDSAAVTGSFKATADTSGFPFLFFNDGNNSNRKGVVIQCGADSPSSQGDCVYLQFKDGDATATGGVQNGSTVANPEFFNGSDERVKRDIASTKINGLEIINNLEMKEFRWSPEYLDYSDLIRIGFIAQNCEKIYPEMVSNMNDPRFPFSIKTISKGELIPVLTKALQEASLKIDALESRIRSLEDSL